MATKTLLHKILARNYSSTATVTDFDTGNTLQIPIEYHIGKPIAGEKKLTGHECKYFNSKNKRNCIQHCIDMAKGSGKTDILNAFTPTHDNTWVRCSNPYCKNKADGDKHIATGNVFHASCYSLFIAQEAGKEHLCKNEYDTKSPLHVTQTIVFPVCQARCWNKVDREISNYRSSCSPYDQHLYQIRTAVEEDDPSKLPSWEKDWIVHDGPTSMSVLIDWITDENNGSAYFGAADKQTGNTKGITKGGYCNMIARIIKTKLGEFHTIIICQKQIIIDRY